MAILATVIFLVFILIRYFNGKSTVALILFWILTPPVIKLASLEFDSGYIVVFVLFFVVAIKNRGRFSLSPHFPHKYLPIMLFVSFIYIISWILFNRTNPDYIFIYSCGTIKNVMMLWLCWLMNRNFDNKSTMSSISKMLTTMTFLNLGLVLLQSIAPETMVRLLGQLYGSTYLSMIDNITYQGTFNRFIGLFRYPAELGIFSLLVIAYHCFIIKDSNQYRKTFTCIGAVIVGLSSTSKSFLLGIILLLIMLIIYNSMESFKRRKSLVVPLIFLITLLSFYIFKNQIINFFASLDSSLAFHVSYYIQNISQSFSNRFGEQGSFIVTGSLDFIKSNILFGVGPTSISGEMVIDNALLVILHNGGMVALAIVLSFYIKITLQSLKQKNTSILFAILILLATGMTYDTWTVAGTVSSWFVFAILLIINGSGCVHKKGKITEEIL